jgi:serpin B
MSGNHILPCFGKILATLLALAWSLAVALPAGGATESDTAVTAINALGVDLLRQVGKPDANTLISPYSIQSALAMAYAGADGVTRTEMARALHYPADGAALDRLFADLRESLKKLVQDSEERARQSRQYGVTNDPVSLAVANRLFGQTGYDFRERFLALTKDTYEAPFEPLDFVKNPDTAAQHINGWVEAQTMQRIRNLIPDGTLNDLTRLVLVNALYLKAPWNEPFQAAATKPGPFHVSVSKTTEVPMMTQRHEFSYAEGDGFTAVELPLGDHQLAFLILLPKRMDGLASVERRLSSAVVAGKLKWENRDVTLHLPRFKLEPATLPLGSALQSLGMKSAFDIPRGSANFERIAPRRPGDYLSISEVFHKTFLNLDEKGVEAAAATAAHFMTKGIHEPAKRIEMRVDHPFVFAIVHAQSGACLFLGHVTDPR